MNDVSNGLLGSPAARLGAYGLILAGSLGVGAAVGAAFGPEPSDTADPRRRPHGARATRPTGSPPATAATTSNWTRR